MTEESTGKMAIKARLEGLTNKVLNKLESSIDASDAEATKEWVNITHGCLAALDHLTPSAPPAVFNIGGVNALQEPETEEVDVGEQARDGEKVGEGAEGQEAEENLPKDEVKVDNSWD